MCGIVRWATSARDRSLNTPLPRFPHPEIVLCQMTCATKQRDMDQLSRRRWTTILAPLVATQSMKINVFGFCCKNIISQLDLPQGRYSCSSPSTKVLHAWCHWIVHAAWGSYYSAVTDQIISDNLTCPLNEKGNLHIVNGFGPFELLSHWELERSRIGQSNFQLGML